MLIRRVKIFLIISFCFYLLSYSFSQTSSYQFSHITKSDGLSGNRISSIIQDSRDFVWIATNNGLNCYNGYEVRCFDRPEGPDANAITSLFEDLSGYIWIGTNGNGLYKYNPELDCFIQYSYNPEDSMSLSNNYINTIYQDQNNSIWIGTTGGGLNLYNATTETFKSYKPITGLSDHNQNIISAIIEDNEGVLWVGTYEGIFHFDRINEKFIPFDKNLEIQKVYQQILCFYQDVENNIWFGTLKGLFKYDNRNSELLHINPKKQNNNDHLPEDVIVAIQGSINSDKEVLWIATKNGLVNYDLNTDLFSRFTIDPSSTNSLSKMAGPQPQTPSHNTESESS